MFHFVVLGTFLLVTALLLATATAGLARAADVHMYWRDVRSHSVPATPAIFVGMMVLLEAGTLLFDLGIHPLLPAGYIIGGILWMVATVLTAAVVVTHHGIIVRCRRVRHRVAWRQVVDYFHFECGGRQGHVFFYVDRSGTRRRLEIVVPARHREQFGSLLSRYVDTRLEPLPEETYGGSTAEG